MRLAAMLLRERDGVVEVRWSALDADTLGRWWFKLNDVSEEDAQQIVQDWLKWGPPYYKWASRADTFEF